MSKKADNLLLAPFGERTRAMYKLVGYTPTPSQQPVLLSTATQILVMGGIQAGKSMLAAKKLVKEFVPDLKRAMAKAEEQGLAGKTALPIIYWLVGNDYDATEREFFYLQNDFEALGLLRRRVRKLNPGQVEIMGGASGRVVLAQIRTKSAKDFRTIRKEAPSGIIGCEASQLDITALERLLERTAPGAAWLFLSGTMEGSSGWYPALAKAWAVAGPDKAAFKLRSSSNYYVFPGGENDPQLVKIRETLTPTLYQERFEGEPCLPSGVVFPEFRPDLHVANVRYEPGVAVQVWEDPGYGSDSAHAILAVQVVEGQVRVVDEIYERGKTTETLIRDMVMHRTWYKDFETLVDDPHYSTQHHANTSTREIWERVTGKKAKNTRERVKPRIERIKTFLLPASTGAAKLVINPVCKGLLSEFGMVPNPFDRQEHVYKWRTDRDGTAIGEEPEDKWNHAIEALGRGLVHNFGHVEGGARRRGWGRTQFFNEVKGGRRGKRKV